MRVYFEGSPDGAFLLLRTEDGRDVEVPLTWERCEGGVADGCPFIEVPEPTASTVPTPDAEHWRAIREFVHRHDIRSGGHAAKMHDDDVESTVLDVLRRALRTAVKERSWETYMTSVAVAMGLRSREGAAYAPPETLYDEMVAWVQVAKGYPHGRREHARVLLTTLARDLREDETDRHGAVEVIEEVLGLFSGREKRAPDDAVPVRDDPTDPNGDKDGIADVDSVPADPLARLPGPVHFDPSMTTYDGNLRVACGALVTPSQSSCDPNETTCETCKASPEWNGAMAPDDDEQEDFDPPGNDDVVVVEREQRRDEFVPIETSTVDRPDGWVFGPGLSFVESATGAKLEWLASARRWFVDNGRSGLDHQRERMEQERDHTKPPFAAASLRAARPTFPHLMESIGDRVLDSEKRVIASPRPGEPPVPTRMWDEKSWAEWNRQCDRVRALIAEVEAAGWSITTL